MGRPLSAARAAGRGFTLIEMLIVLAIGAIVLAMGLPNLTEFVADQRVRTAQSDLVGELTYVRAEAIKNAARVTMARSGATWKDGWRIFVDANANGVLDVGEALLRTAAGPGGGAFKICATHADFADGISFRADGRVVRAGVASAADGLRVSDNRADANPANDKIRSVYLDLTGRPTVVRQNGGTNGGAPCP